MPGVCSVCQHPAVADIDAELVRGVSAYQLAARHPALSHDAIRRHKENGYVSSMLQKAHDAAEVARADVLLEDIATIRATTLKALDTAEAAGDMTTLLRAVREARENVRLLGELQGRLNAGTVVNIVQNPQFVQFQTLVVDAPKPPHPEARAAVLKTLQDMHDA